MCLIYLYVRARFDLIYFESPFEKQYRFSISALRICEYAFYNTDHQFLRAKSRWQ